MWNKHSKHAQEYSIYKTETELYNPNKVESQHLDHLYSYLSSRLLEKHEKLYFGCSLSLDDPTLLQ